MEALQSQAASEPDETGIWPKTACANVKVHTTFKARLTRWKLLCPSGTITRHLWNRSLYIFNTHPIPWHCGELKNEFCICFSHGTVQQWFKICLFCCLSCFLEDLPVIGLAISRKNRILCLTACQNSSLTDLAVCRISFLVRILQ